MNIKNDKKMKTEAIIVDLDNTLLNSNKYISKYTLDILHKCKEKGILLGIATARSPAKAKCFSEEIDADFVLYNNGALIEYQGKYVSELPMEKQLTTRVLGSLLQVKDYVGNVTLETRDGYWKIGNISEIAENRQEKFNQPSFKVTAEIFSEDLVELLKNMFPECRISTFREEKWYRFSDVRVKKSRIIDFLTKCLGVNRKNIVAFGDDCDDIDMLVKAGLGVAVGNAVDAVMEAADFVCESNDQDGVASFIDKYILKN